MKPKHTIAIMKDLARAWKADKVPQTAAAFAYYAIFLIPPFLAIVLVILGLLFGSVVSRQDIFDEFRFLIGRGPAMAMAEVLTAFRSSGFTIPTLIIASMFLIFTGSHAYLSLREAFNRIWGVTNKEKTNWKKMIRNSFISYIFTAGAGLTFIWFVGASTLLLVFSRSMSAYFKISPFVLETLNVLSSFLITMALFMIIYVLVSDVIIRWRDAITGAAVASILLVVGNYALSIYLRYSPIVGVYGIFSTFLIILIWSYYVSLIMFFGLEVTKHYVMRHGHPISIPVNYHFISMTRKMNSIAKKWFTGDF